MARQWNGETFAEKVTGMKEAYTVTSVSASDMCVVLEDWQCAGHARMTVAHISASGWVDVFIGSVNERDPNDDQSRHVAMTPSQFSALMGAYQDWSVDKSNIA